MALTQNLAATVSDQTIGLGYNAASQIATRSSSNDIYAMRQQYNANRGYSVNGLNQYLTAGTAIPTYDARGNLTGQGTSSFTYSSENLLKSATLSSGASTLSYDPAMRLAQTSGSATTRFLYDGTDLVAEYDGAATVVLRRYVHGPGADEPLVWYEGSGTSDRRWLHADERGSIIAVTNGSGTAIGTNAYDEWGNPQSGNLGRFGYTGQTWLPEIGLWYYKARMYNPRLGRFMQTDPIGYGDGMNMYAYVGGDPVNFSDPSGLATIAFESCRTLTGIGTYSADGGAIPDGSAIVVTGKKEKCSLEYAYIPDSFYEQPQSRPAPLKNTPPGKGQVQKEESIDDKICDFALNPDAVGAAVGGVVGQLAETFTEKSAREIMNMKQRMTPVIGSKIVSARTRAALIGSRAGVIGAVAGYAIGAMAEEYFPEEYKEFEKALIQGCKGIF